MDQYTSHISRTICLLVFGYAVGTHVLRAAQFLQHGVSLRTNQPSGFWKRLCGDYHHIVLAETSIYRSLPTSRDDGRPHGWLCRSSEKMYRRDLNLNLEKVRIISFIQGCVCRQHERARCVGVRRSWSIPCVFSCNHILELLVLKVKCPLVNVDTIQHYQTTIPLLHSDVPQIEGPDVWKRVILIASLTISRQILEKDWVDANRKVKS